MTLIQPLVPKWARERPTSHGPRFRWFAWHPVWTEDRGWRWLRMVHRRRFYLELPGEPAMAWWVHSVSGK